MKELVSYFPRTRSYGKSRLFSGGLKGGGPEQSKVADVELKLLNDAPTSAGFQKPQWDCSEKRLINTRLAYANFSFANLSKSNFTRSDLRNANLTSSNMSEVKLANCNLLAIDLGVVSISKLNSKVNVVTSSIDDRYFAAGDDTGTINVWGKTKKYALQDATGITALVFSPNLHFIASANDENAIKVWEFTMNRHQTFDGHSEGVLSLAFSPNNKYLASGSRDGSIKVWRIDFVPHRTFLGHSNSVMCLAFTPDGKNIISGGLDGTIRKWDFQTGSMNILKNICTPESMAFSKDLSIFATADRDNKITVFDFKRKSEKEVTVLSHDVKSIAFSHDNTKIVLGNCASSIDIFDLNTGESRSILSHIASVNSASFFDYGSFVVSGGDDCTVQVWSLKSNQNRKRLKTI